MHTVSPSYSPTVARECLHIKCTVGLYDGNPNDLYSVDELKYFVDRTKHTGIRSKQRQDFSDDLQPSQQVLGIYQIIKEALAAGSQKCYISSQLMAVKCTPASLIDMPLRVTPSGWIFISGNSSPF